MRRTLSHLVKKAAHERPARPPTLVGFDGTATDAWLTISSPRDDGAPLLLLVGRSTGVEVRAPLAEDSRGWQGHVTDEDLAVFEGETIDLHLALDDGAATRRRVAGGVDLAPFAAEGQPRRWYITVEGNVSVRRRRAAEVIAESGTFDVDHYLGEVARSSIAGIPEGMDPIEHYVAKGAAEGLDPSPMFDTTYYQRMNPTVRRNPLAHYRETGRRQGLSTRPEPSPSRRVGIGHRFPEGRDVRRVCLFAGYDPQGVVDDYVVAYIRELARHADVYYLADGEMPDPELARLAEHTEGAWAEPHGEYDFGSYSRLIDRVG
ncbi:hypothetical protein [Isoptericola rhizosphaerae]|uniref:hypothetical protein n=1 Tax=Isoptericola rhizosphaerae TaxID=3377837 RepID=UPI00383B18E4